MNFWRHLFSADFLPHGMCYRWDPAVLWLNVISDLLIASAYYAIPVLLFWLVKRRRDIAFNWLFIAFGVFILACGTTHLMGAVTAWEPVYRLDGVIKAITAVASIATAWMLAPMIPVVASLPSPAELARANEQLAIEVAERKAAEHEVRRANETLEARVQARTTELAQSESLFRQLAEAMPQMVWVTDSEGVHQYFNRQWYDYTGTTIAPGGGYTGASPLHPEDLEQATALWQEAIQTGEMYETEYRLRRRDGIYRWFLARGTPARDAHGTVTRWFGTCTDIDDQKRAAESLERALSDLQREMKRRHELEEQLLQAQKMEAIGRLAGGIAHDFNNLLTAILGYNEMIREEVRNNLAASEFAEEVLHAAERASALTQQLLAFSRRQIAQPQVLDLSQQVRNLDRMLRRIIGEDVELQTKLTSGLYPVRIDPTHLDQVILNLAVNSRDAMPEGGTLTIETTNTELSEEDSEMHVDLTPGPYAVLTVSDTGTGMDAATRSLLFEPFFTTKEKGKGTGLGLSIVYGIVKQNEGAIMVYSEPGQGAVFKIYLPSAAATVQEEAAASRPTAENATETVLLVEDEDQVRSLSRSMLVRAGYTVLLAESGAEALLVSREYPGVIHALVTDVVMPRMGGIELAQTILRERPAVRVLYISGYTGGATGAGTLPAGTPFLQKPFTSAALRRKLREVLDDE